MGVCRGMVSGEEALGWLKHMLQLHAVCKGRPETQGHRQVESWWLLPEARTQVLVLT